MERDDREFRGQIIVRLPKGVRVAPEALQACQTDVVSERDGEPGQPGPKRPDQPKFAICQFCGLPFEVKRMAALYDNLAYCCMQHSYLDHTLTDYADRLVALEQKTLNSREGPEPPAAESRRERLESLSLWILERLLADAAELMEDMPALAVKMAVDFYAALEATGK